MTIICRLDDAYWLDDLNPPPSHLLTIERWAEHHSRQQVAADDFLRLSQTQRGMHITIHRSHVDGRWRATEKVAQLRWNLTSRKWTLWWPDRYDHWQPYQPEIATRQVGRLLRVIDEDADSVFWG